MWTDERVELCRFVFHITARLLSDMDGFLATIPPDDPRHDKVATAFAGAGPAL